MLKCLVPGSPVPQKPERLEVDHAQAAEVGVREASRQVQLALSHVGRPIDQL